MKVASFDPLNMETLAYPETKPDRLIGCGDRPFEIFQSSISLYTCTHFFSCVRNVAQESKRLNELNKSTK